MSAERSTLGGGTHEPVTRASDRHSGPGEASGREVDILALIDGAIEDYTISGDAMRWTPDDGQPRIGGSPWITTDEVHAMAFDNSDATLTRFSLNGIDVTPYVSSVEIRGAEPHLTIIDETHRWTESAYAGIVTGISAVGQPPPFTAESLMETYRALSSRPARHSYVCHADEYDRIKAGLDERGVEVDLTGSPHVPYGQVIRYESGPLLQAGVDYQLDYRTTFGRDLAAWRAEYLQRPLTPIRIAGLFGVPAYMVARPRPRRAKLRAIHAAYRAKTRRRNRRNR